MKKNILLALASIAFIVVWTTFYLFISDDNKEASSYQTLEVNSEQDISNLAIEENVKGPTPQVPIEKSNKYVTRGIQYGDFADIAPNKIISVEVLLDRIK